MSDIDFDVGDDEDEIVTAYHESGHAIIGCALGAHIEHVGLSQASAYDDWDDGLPRRFGDCLVNWGRVDPGQPWQQQKELLTILAGPVAQWTYQDRDVDELDVASWADDFDRARQTVAALDSDPVKQTLLIRQAIGRLRVIMATQSCWAAIAALADELMLGDCIDGDRVSDIVRFWWSRD